MLDFLPSLCTFGLIDPSEKSPPLQLPLYGEPSMEDLKPELYLASPNGTRNTSKCMLEI